LSAQLPFDASKINWQKSLGPRGEFELSDEYGNPEHKALLKFLEFAGGTVASEGFFYWIFQSDGRTIGRKKSERRCLVRIK
jgi:hypothetical protein